MNSKQAHDRLKKAGLTVSEVAGLNQADRALFTGSVRLVWRDADAASAKAKAESAAQVAAAAAAKVKADQQALIKKQQAAKLKASKDR